MTQKLPNVTWNAERSFAGNLPVQRTGHPNNTLFFLGFEKSQGSLTAPLSPSNQQPWGIWLNGGWILLSLNVMRNVKHKYQQSRLFEHVWHVLWGIYVHSTRFSCAHVHNRTDQFNSKAIIPQNPTHTVGINWRITFGLINQCMYGSDSLNSVPHLLNLQRRWLLDIRRDWLWYTNSCRLPDVDANSFISS